MKLIKRIFNVDITTFLSITIGLILVAIGLYVRENTTIFIGVIAVVFALTRQTGSWIIASSLSLLTIFMFIGFVVPASMNIWSHAGVPTMGLMLCMYISYIALSYTSSSYEFYNRWLFASIVSITSTLIMLFVGALPNVPYILAVFSGVTVYLIIITLNHIRVTRLKKSIVENFKYTVTETQGLRIIKLDDISDFTNHNVRTFEFVDRHGFKKPASGFIMREAIDAYENKIPIAIIIPRVSVVEYIPIEKKLSNKGYYLMFAGSTEEALANLDDYRLFLDY